MILVIIYRIVRPTPRADVWGRNVTAFIGKRPLCPSTLAGPLADGKEDWEIYFIFTAPNAVNL